MEEKQHKKEAKVQQKEQQEREEAATLKKEDEKKKRERPNGSSSGSVITRGNLMDFQIQGDKIDCTFCYGSYMMLENVGIGWSVPVENGCTKFT